VKKKNPKKKNKKKTQLSHKAHVVKGSLTLGMWCAGISARISLLEGEMPLHQRTIMMQKGGACVAGLATSNMAANQPQTQGKRDLLRLSWQPT